MRQDDPEIDHMDIKPLFQNRNFTLPSSTLDKYKYSDIIDYLSPGTGWNLHTYKLDLVQKMLFITYIKPYSQENDD